MLRGPLSIRARVTIAATAAVALVLIAGAVLTVATFAQRERSSLDRELESRATGRAGRVALRGPALVPGRGAEALLPGGRRPGRRGSGDERGGDGGQETGPGGLGGGPGEPPPPGLLSESGTFVRVFADGQVLQAAGDLPADDFPEPREAGFDTVESDGRTWRTYTVEPPAPPPEAIAGAAPQRIQFAADLEPVEDRIGAMRARVALISGLGIALAAVLASVLSGVALGPLSRLRRSVAGISGTRDLSRRLPGGDAAEEVDELADSVNAMLTRLERSAGETEDALEATRRFAADVGHELRTPLTSIRANMDALRRNPSMPEAERRAILEEMASEQQSLVALLDSLQALARGDAGAALPRESLDLAEVVDAVVEAARRRHPGASVELDAADERHLITGWPDGLRLLVENLVENALRHGGMRARIGLRREDGGRVLLLTVEDDGPGVPEPERERIFERFARGKDTLAPGSGLGLALVAQQAALHGGDVAVGDSELGGARFAVRLPSGEA